MRHIQENGFGTVFGTGDTKAKEASPDDLISLHDKILKWIQQCETSTPEMEFRKVSAEDLEFYAGRQDTPEVLAALEAQKIQFAKEKSRYTSFYGKIQKLKTW